MQFLAAETVTLPGSNSRAAFFSPAPLTTTFKKKQYATPSQWQAHKATIKKLYLDENHTLPEVRAILQDRHDFHATINMYKKRLRAWGFTKNIQESEARSLLVEQLKRMNAQQDAAAAQDDGGRLQPSDKRFQRYMRRNPYLLWQVGASARPSRSSESPLSSTALEELPFMAVSLDSVDMCCSALVSPSRAIRLGAPAATRHLERTLLAVRCYIQTNKVISEAPRTHWRRIVLGHSPNKPVVHLGADLVKFHDTFTFVADALNCDSNPVITQLLQPHFERIKSLLQQQHPDLISSMMRMSIDMAAKKRPELARAVHNYLLEMTPIVCTASHPMAIAWTSMRQWLMSEGNENMNDFCKTIMLASETEIIEALTVRNITGLGTRERPTIVGGVAKYQYSLSDSPCSSNSTLGSSPSNDDDAWHNYIGMSPSHGKDASTGNKNDASSEDSIAESPAHNDAPWVTPRVLHWQSLHLQWSKAQAATGNLDVETSAIVSQALTDLSVGQIHKAEDGMRKVLEKPERLAKQKSATRARAQRTGHSSSRQASVSQEGENPHRSGSHFPTDDGNKRSDSATIHKRPHQDDSDNSVASKPGSVPNLITWIIMALGMARVRHGDGEAAQEHFRWVIAEADRRKDLVVRNIGMTMLRYILKDEVKQAKEPSVAEGREQSRGRESSSDLCASEEDHAYILSTQKT